MLHYNQEVRKYIPFGSVITFFLPECYEAASIKDLLDNQELIKATSFMPFRVAWGTCTGRAVIGLSTSVVYNAVDDRRGNIADLTGSIDVFLNALNTKDRNYLMDGRRLYEPSFLYRPSDDIFWLGGFKRYGPRQTNRENSSVPLEMIAQTT